MRSVVRPFSLLLAVVAGSALLIALPAQRPASAAAPNAGSFVAVTPTRVVDTRTGAGGVPKSAVGAGATVAAQIGGHASVPSSDVSAVAVTITSVAPTQVGAVIAWQDGQARPTATNLQYGKGQQVSNLAIVPISTVGKIDLYNRSTGTVQLVVDVSGYYVGGANPSQSGSYTPVSPSRVVDTRYGTGGNRKGALGANATTVAKIGGQASVPSSNVSAVAVTITSVAPTQAGAVIAWQDGQARPTATNLQYGKGQQVSNLAVVPVSSIGRIDLYNRSSGTVQLVVDVSGYFVGGVPSTAGALGTLTPARVLDTRNGTDGNRNGVVPANTEIPVQVGGNGGVPKAGVTAVVVTITSVAPTSTGSVIAWARGTTRPTVTNLQYRAGQQVSNLAVVPMSAAGTINLYNRSSGSTHLVLDVSGYVLKSDLSIPPTSTSHYVRNITGADSDSDAMMAEGQADAAGGSKLVLLDIGAQLNDKTGVALTVTGVRITYGQLRHAIQGYLVGFGSVPGATIAIATNNDATDWTHYTAAARGADWADQVIDQLVAPIGVSVVGADDIEAGFFSTEAQAQAWETAYLGAATTKELIYAGSADGCPTTFGATHKTCSYGWTQAQYYSLAGGSNPGHIQALPQIYVPAQAVQWAGIDATGGDAISFAGALTEHAACPTAGSPGCTFAALPPGQGWAALYHSLATLFATPSIPLVSDLRIDS